MSTLIHDIKYAFRQLRKSPGFAALVVLTLGLGIGANTAIFGFLDRILLRPLPVSKAHELVMVAYQSGKDTYSGFTYPYYCGLLDQANQVFSGMTAYAYIEADIGSDDQLREVPGVAVSSDYFSVLGVNPVAGRGFLSEEDRSPGSHPVVVISHKLWQKRFNGDPAVIGQTFRVNKHPLTVVGVAPADFHGTFAGVESSVYVPLSTWACIKGISLDEHIRTWLSLMGRVKPGGSRERAQAALRVAAQRMHAIEPTNTPTEIVLTDGSQGDNPWLAESLWWPFALIQFLTVLILVVACSNIANLLLARGTTRQAEMAIRRAIGAGRARIVRQLLVESALLALLSGLCGALLAHWFSIALGNALLGSFVINLQVGVDGRVLMFALLISFASVLLFGLVPALHVSRRQPMAVLKEGAGAIRVFKRWWNLQNFLVAGQIAVSVIVLVFGVLCMRSLGKVKFINPGFDPQKVLGVSIDYKRGPIAVSDAQRFCTDLQRRIAAYPNVQAVSLASHIPLSGEGWKDTGAGYVEGYAFPPDLDTGGIPWPHTNVGPGHFRTLGVPLLQGREFSIRDGPEAPKVMIVNELLAQHYWPNQNPIGKRVKCGAAVREVVGVVKTSKLSSLTEETQMMSYWPMTQADKLQPGLPAEAYEVWLIKPVVLIRVAGDPKAVITLVRNELEGMGLNPAVYDVCSIADWAWDVLIVQRMMAGILNIIGLFGLFFVATGVFSVMAYEVGRRTREVGIRMALGAQWADVCALVLRKGAFLTAAGLGVGMAVSFVPLYTLGHLIPEIYMWGDSRLLYGVQLWDPPTYVGAALLIAFIALIACYIPARRAARIDPMEALRYE